jgi:ABC-type glycerol-3-phosphate transport system permease component
VARSVFFEEKGRRPVFFLIRVTMALIALACLVLAFVQWQSNHLAAQSKDWPTVPGVVTDTWVLKTRDTVRTGRDDYSPRVKYAYTVEGSKYESSTLGLKIGPGVYNDRPSAEARIASYARGSTVVVHYRPSNPATACLEPGGASTTSTVGAVLLFLVIGGLCAWGLVAMPRPGRRNREGNLS